MKTSADPKPAAAKPVPPSLQPGSPHYRPVRVEKEMLAIYVTPAAKRAIRILAAELSTTIQKLGEEGFNHILAKNGKPEIMGAE